MRAGRKCERMLSLRKAVQTAEMIWRRTLVCAFAAVAIVLPQQGEAMDKVMLNSSAFESNGPIPAKFTCEGEDVSPALTWSSVPSGTSYPLR